MYFCIKQTEFSVKENIFSGDIMKCIIENGMTQLSMQAT